MALYALREDFEAVGRQHGHREPAFNDAWQDYCDTWDGPMHAFFKARKETHPFRYAAAADSTVENELLFSLKAQSD